MPAPKLMVDAVNIGVCSIGHKTVLISPDRLSTGGGPDHLHKSSVISQVFNQFKKLLAYLGVSFVR